nr:uncharacterized protein LOC129283941 [Lytechinus pictus]
MTDLINSTEEALILVMGDFNDLVTDVIEQYALLTQVVTKPTRGDSVLDKILTNLPELFEDPVIHAPIASCDHRVVVMRPHDCIQPLKTSKLKIRPFRDSSVREFGQWITDFNWEELNATCDPDEMVDILHCTLMTQYKRCFPEKYFKRRARDKPWFNVKIRSLINQRELAHRSRKFDRYHQLRNKVQREISRAKSTYFRNKVEHLKQSEPGKWHRQIRSLTGMTKKPSFSLGPEDESPRQIAENLNVHFSQVCNVLPPLDLSALPAYLPAPSSPPVIQEHEVYKRLKRLNASKAPHPNDVPTRLFKEFALEISGPLSKIFNECLKFGYFPAKWKCASVCAVPKTQRVTCLDQLRPISITSVLSRLFESFLADWLMTDLRPHIDPSQYGNMKGSSINHYLVDMLDLIYRSLERSGCYANICTIDFTKAF